MRSLPLLLALLLPVGASAQGSPAPVEEEEEKEEALWGWVDDGGWHFVDSLDLVPAAYRSTATKMRVTREAPPVNRNRPPTSPAPGYDRPPTKEELEAAEEEKAKAEAPSREERIAEIEARLLAVLGEIAAMEEGNVPESYVSAAGGEEKLTNEVLGQLMEGTEEELDRLEAELARLKAAR